MIYFTATIGAVLVFGGVALIATACRLVDLAGIGSLPEGIIILNIPAHPRLHTKQRNRRMQSQLPPTSKPKFLAENCTALIIPVEFAANRNALCRLY